MTALILGTLLALGSLAFVLLPVFADAEPEPLRRAGSARPGTDSETPAIDALREIEFDRATGKLADADYAALKAEYTAHALAELRARDAAAGDSAAGDSAGPNDAPPVLDAAEAAVLAYRRRQRPCPQCGPRPEPDAAYCSTCGRYLAGACARCGADVQEIGAQFCAGCGATLAA